MFSYLCGLSFFFVVVLVLHALKVLVTYVGSQSLLPYHYMNGVGTAKEAVLQTQGFPLCCRLETAEIPTIAGGLQQPVYSHSLKANIAKWGWLCLVVGVILSGLGNPKIKLLVKHVAELDQGSTSSAVGSLLQYHLPA